jgi:transposase
MCHNIGVTLSEIDISGAIKRAKEITASDKKLSSSVRAVIELLVLIVELLVLRRNVNSRNSSTPPSQDPHRERGRKVRGERKRKPGGQPGHKGGTISRIENPDKVELLSVDRRKLPRGHEYKRVQDDVRQVIDIEIKRKVTEYRAEVLEDERGRQYRAEFPQGVTRPVQYGASVKAEAVYLSVYQLLPNHRVQDFFRDQAGIELSVGTLQNFRREAYERLEQFEKVARNNLREATIAHFDETGININGKLAWLHSASNDEWTLYGAHEQRGREGIDALGVLPYFSGIACHDHWKAYFNYTECLHVLCNSHHTRELTGIIENEGHRWAQEMRDLLQRIYAAVEKANGRLSSRSQAAFRKQYRQIIARGKRECPAAPKISGKRGRTKQSKPRNLLDRLEEFEDETLRFITNPIIPFTNNLAERDIRMTKLQQKISGCFKSLQTAQVFFRARSFLSTSVKRGLSATEALTGLFNGKIPEFIQPQAP